MDIVYICRKGENEELRYSLRSVAKNLPESRVWVVGGKPKWYTGNYIQVEQNTTKYANAMKNLYAIIQSDEISDDFVLMNDDFYVIKPIKDIETYNVGSIYAHYTRYCDKYGRNSYSKLLLNTLNRLKKAGIKDPISYEAHVPMKMNKHKLLETFKYKSCLWRSVYGNLFNDISITIQDVKIYNKTDIDKIDYELPYISSVDESFLNLYSEVLSKMFPDPSKYEAVTMIELVNEIR
jgi:hypothetical protein